MSDRVMMAAMRFAGNIERLNDATDILEALHQVARLAGLNVLGAWRVPPWGQRDDVDGFHIHPHPSVPDQFWADFRALYAKHRRSFMAELAWQNRGPFTMTEAMRIMRPTGDERWIVRLLDQYGIRDVFYVPNGTWMVVYWAAKLLRLDAPTKAVLLLAANATAERLRAMSRRRGEDGAGPELSARQRAVLRLLGQGYTPQEIGRRLEISHGTVKEHIERASKKLGARTATQAAVEAVRRYAVLSWLAAMTLATAAGLCDVHHPDCWITHILEGRHSHVPGSTRVGL